MKNERLIISADKEVLDAFYEFFSDRAEFIIEEATSTNSDFNKFDAIEGKYQFDFLLAGQILSIIASSGIIPVIIGLFKPHTKKCKIKISERSDKKTTELHFSGMSAKEIKSVLEEIDLKTDDENYNNKVKK